MNRKKKSSQVNTAKIVLRLCLSSNNNQFGKLLFNFKLQKGSLTQRCVIKGEYRCLFLTSLLPYMDLGSILSLLYLFTFLKNILSLLTRCHVLLFKPLVQYGSKIKTLLSTFPNLKLYFYLIQAYFHITLIYSIQVYIRLMFIRIHTEIIFQTLYVARDT